MQWGSPGSRGRKDRTRKPGQEGTRVTWVRDDSGSEQDASRGGAKRRFRCGVFGRQRERICDDEGCVRTEGVGKEEARVAPLLGLSRWEHGLPCIDGGRLRGAGLGEMGLTVGNPVLSV